MTQVRWTILGPAQASASCASYVLLRCAPHMAPFRLVFAVLLTRRFQVSRRGLALGTSFGDSGRFGRSLTCGRFEEGHEWWHEDRDDDLCRKRIAATSVRLFALRGLRFHIAK
jgi:hypothetical protein